MSNLCLVMVLGLVVPFVLADDDDCIYKGCYCGDGDIYCTNLNLKAMPRRQTTNNSLITYLEMDGNQITTIPAGSLPQKLADLSLAGNPIETIDDAAFDESIYTLKQLSFSQARFTQIPEAVFQLKALSSLSISATDILEWNDTSMRQFGPTMKTLSLDSVGLTTWPTWVKSMANLTELTISGSSISFIPDDALALLVSSLTILDLHNNSLSKLPQSLAKMTVLQKLTLDHNMITDVTYLPQLSPLQILSLNNNRITNAQNLSSALKPHADTLIRIDIQDNRLISIPELSFLTQISTLDLTFNRISDASSGSVPFDVIELKMDYNAFPFIPRFMKSLQSIYMLHLNSNYILSIDGTEFPPQANYVDLGSNLISYLTNSSFPNNSKIEFLYLNNNPISTISQDVFNNLLSLSELDLRQTKLTRLPLAIASLNSLESLDVSNNTHLVCTCQERSLQERIQAIGSMFMKGDCGLTTVYFFFTKLSLHCSPL